MEKKLYKQALFCFAKAGHQQGQILCKAYLHRQEAEDLYITGGSNRRAIDLVYTQSAILFDQADHPQRASECYEIIGKFRDAAGKHIEVTLILYGLTGILELWTARGRPARAAPMYEKCELWGRAVESYTRARLFTEATKALRSGKCYDELVNYLYEYVDQLRKFLSFYLLTHPIAMRET